jgi:hypothetical protein
MGKATEEKHRAAGEEGRPPTAQFRTEKDDEKAAIAGPFFTYLSRRDTPRTHGPRISSLQSPAFGDSSHKLTARLVNLSFVNTHTHIRESTDT